MATTTEIITTSEVKTLAVVNSNLDTAYIDQYILMTQRKYIRPFLGTDYYDEILDQLDDTSTLTADNSTLITSYIKPALAHYVVYESLPQVRNQIAKGGVFNNLSETSDIASGQDYGRLRDDYLIKAETFIKEIDLYIKDQQDVDGTKYPLYCGKNQQNGGIIFY